MLPKRLLVGADWDCVDVVGLRLPKRLEVGLDCPKIEDMVRMRMRVRQWKDSESSYFTGETRSLLARYSLVTGKVAWNLTLLSPIACEYFSQFFK